MAGRIKTVAEKAAGAIRTCARARIKVASNRTRVAIRMLVPSRAHDPMRVSFVTISGTVSRDPPDQIQMAPAMAIDLIAASAAAGEDADVDVVAAAEEAKAEGAKVGAVRALRKTAYRCPGVLKALGRKTRSHLRRRPGARATVLIITRLKTASRNASFRDRNRNIGGRHPRNTGVLRRCRGPTVH